MRKKNKKELSPLFLILIRIFLYLSITLETTNIIKSFSVQVLADATEIFINYNSIEKHYINI